MVFVAAITAVGHASNVVYTSPSAAFQVELSDPGTSDAIVVSTKNPKQRSKLADSRAADEFHLSPDNEWVFELRHVGSGLRDGDLYHRTGAPKLDAVALGRGFSATAWTNALKLGAIKRNFDAEGLYAMTYFGGWSADGSRLLVIVGGGEEKRSFQFGYLYFNLRKKQFEVTAYLKKAGKTGDFWPACAEPLTPLPAEDALKKQYEQADAKLNKAYQEKLARLAKDEAAALRDEQRTWIKERDLGLAIYVDMGPPAEKERRRFQYLASVSAARTDTLNARE